MKLGDAMREAQRLLDAGEYPAALRAFLHLATSAPPEPEVRLGVAEVLARVGLDAEAAELYGALGRLLARSGRPLPAMLAAHAVRALGRSATDVIAEVAAIYANGSPRLARFGVRPAPPDPNLELPPLAPGTLPFDELATHAARAALTPTTDLAGQVPPVPFLSELGTDELAAVLAAGLSRTFADGQEIVRQGEPGTALYIVGVGEVRVFSTRPDGTVREHARLYENALFGEMALLSDQPRSASVAAVGRASLLEISREALAQVATLLPAVGVTLDRFARERLIKNLLATSPLFVPFTKAQQADLLKRFEGIEFAPGAEVIRQGVPGEGLFVVLSGEFAVETATDAGPLELARLRSGDVFGEMSLLTQQPTTASVRALAPGTTLFLARGYFERLMSAIPELRQYFVDLVASRSEDNRRRLGRRAVSDEPMELSDDDLMLI